MNQEVSNILESSGSKASIGDTRDTCLDSGSKTTWEKPSDDLQEGSINFSDIFHGDIFKTPQKAIKEQNIAVKFTAPTKSQIKEDLDDECLGKRTRLEEKYLDEHLEKYMRRTMVRRSKRIHNKVSPRGSIELKLDETENEEYLQPKDQELSVSTNLTNSRQNPNEDFYQKPLPDHKNLFSLLSNKSNGDLGLAEDEKISDHFLSDGKSMLLGLRESETDSCANRPLGVAQIVSLCQNISQQTHSILNNLKELNKKALEGTSGMNTNEENTVYCVDPEQEALEDRDGLKARSVDSESMILETTSSHQKQNTIVESSFTCSSLPKILQELLLKFSKLDFIVYETTTKGRLSLLGNHIKYLEKACAL